MAHLLHSLRECPHGFTNASGALNPEIAYFRNDSAWKDWQKSTISYCIHKAKNPRGPSNLQFGQRTKPPPPCRRPPPLFPTSCLHMGDRTRLIKQHHKTRLCTIIKIRTHSRRHLKMYHRRTPLYGRLFRSTLTNRWDPQHSGVKFHILTNAQPQICRAVSHGCSSTYFGDESTA